MAFFLVNINRALNIKYSIKAYFIDDIAIYL